MPENNTPENQKPVLLSLHDRFEAVDDDYIKFERIASPRSRRPDLHAFLLLDELQPGTTDMISASEHDEFFLDIDIEKLNEVITDEQILELTRCGIRVDESNDCLSMFA